MVVINQNICPESNWDNKCPFGMTPTRIVVHNTANDASAANEIAYMNRNDNYVSFHFAVDDVQALQGIYENRNSWNAGDGTYGTGNREGIAIEICYSLSGGDRFIKAEQNAAELCAILLKKYGWGIDKVTKHQDYSGKYCPHRTLDMGWDRFLNMVKFQLNPSVPVPNAIKLDKPERYTANFDGVKLWKLETNPNYQSAKEFAKGEILEFVAYIPFNNTKYMITDYSYNKGIKNGVNIADLTPVHIPVTTFKEDKVITNIPFKSTTVNDPNLLVGKKETRTIGVNGSRTIIYEVTLSDGVETKRTVKSDVTIPPVDEVVAVGTKDQHADDHKFIAILRELWNIIADFFSKKGKQ